MDFETVVKKRRMCREYLDRHVPQEKVDRILDIACRYPSAGHTEPQEFVVVRDQRVKEALARAALGQMFVAQAPLVIVVVSDTRRSAQRYGERGVRFYSIIDGAFVAMLILLTAVDEAFRRMFCCGVSRSGSAAGFGLAPRRSPHRGHPYRLLRRGTKVVGAPIQGTDRPS
jgi:nitroreductase